MIKSSLPGIPGDDLLHAWTQDQTQRTKSRLQDATFETDCAAIEDLMNAKDNLPGISRRGAWIYSFRQTEDNPRGLWRKVKDGTELNGETDWQTVFDLDAFCAQTDEVWHWRGAATAWFDPDRVMLCLSLNGSDQNRFIEFDCAAGKIVTGGFDLPPSRGRVEWLDADTMLVSDALSNGAATRSGWPGQIRQLSRGTTLSEAPVVFDVAPKDLLAASDVTADTDGNAVQWLVRMIAIGQQECTVRRAGRPDVVLPMPRDTTCRNSATHYAYIVQKDGGTPGSLILGQIDTPGTRILFEPRAGASVPNDSLILVENWMLWKVIEDMHPTLWALDLRDPDAMPRQIELPDAAENFWAWQYDAAPETGDGSLVLHITGFLTPATLYRFDLNSGPEKIDWNLLWRAPAAFDAPDHEVSLHWATSKDGTQVPYHLVAPKGAQDMPTLLYGYGGYGVILSPHYPKITGKLWMEKGGAYVLAYIRGGGELGPDWHLQAKGPGRDKAFEDFVAISRDLVARGVTTAERIACHGGSNGGLLCGVMLTRYPEDFGAVWASVGVYDMLKYHEFEAGAAWIDEYGDPDDPKAATWLRAYSPLHNIAPQSARSYPPALVDTSASDDRVHPAHSRWFGWQLNAAAQDVYYAEHSDGGHGGGGSSRAVAEEQALGYAFLRQTIGARVMQPIGE